MSRRTKFFLFLIIIVLTIGGCGTKKIDISFYHWQTELKSDSFTTDLLNKVSPSKLYVHYFDVDYDDDPKANSAVFPKYVLKKVDSIFKNYHIIPVVFITNRSLKNQDSSILAEHITKLVLQISAHHFQNKPIEIQLDCDWTVTTKDQYFALVKLLNQKFDVSCTIRLHQIKYTHETGVPPAKTGVLMLYNMGDLRNKNENSILDFNIVTDYLDAETTYPLQLDIALPAFSQTVILGTNGLVKLINQDIKNKLVGNFDFNQIDTDLFELRKDTLMNGFFLKKGFLIKVEHPGAEEIVKSYNYLENCALNLSNTIIFYHLDHTLASKEEIQNIISHL